MKPRLIALALLAAILPATVSAQQTAEQRQLVRENFQQADKNDDGKLDSREYRAFINAIADDDIGRAAMVRRFGAYDRAFSRVDADNNGEITPTELTAARGS